MAFTLKTGLSRLAKKYINALKAGWDAVKTDKVATKRPMLLLKQALKETALYLDSHNGQARLQPLDTPTLNSQQITTYERELLGALDEQPHIRNIAISSTCATSKRAFLQAFVQRNPQFEYLHLAATDATETDIQNSISQKLIANAEKPAPFSGTHSRHWKKFLAICAALLTSTSIATFSFFSGYLDPEKSTVIKALRFYLPDDTTVLLKKYAPLVAEFSLFLLATLLVLFVFEGMLKLTGLRKHDHHRGSTSAGHVTHLMSQKQIAVVIENVSSTEQLRALQNANTNLNQPGQSNTAVRFIFSVDDETFTAQSRTRFFDLIIPIVPFAQTNRNGAQLFTALKAITNDAQNMAGNLNQQLISKMAECIDDSRQITNIVNEFDIYLHNLTTSMDNLDANKIFAMVVIKNLYPKEHGALARNTGVLKQIFTDFKTHKQTLLKAYHQEIRQRANRKTLLSRSPEKNEDSYANELAQLQYTKSKLQGATLFEALKLGIVESFIKGLAEPQFAPLLYLLRHGYFAEDYSNYLSCFNAIDISADDKRLALRLSAGQYFKFTQPVNSPCALLNHLSPSALTNGKGFINAIVNELLTNPQASYNGFDAESFLFELFDLSEQQAKRLFGFISQYLQNNPNHQRQLFETLYINNRSLLMGYLTGTSLDKNQAQKAGFVACILSFINASDREILSSALTSAVSTLEDIQPIYELGKERPEIWAWLKSQHVRFDRIALPHCSQELAFKLLEDNLFEMNPHMVGLLLAFSTDEQPEELAKISYSAITTCGHHKLICQMNEHLGDFVKNILLAQPRLKEEQHFLIEMLNSPKLTTDDKLQLLQHTRQKIGNIKDMEDHSLCTKLLEKQLLTTTWGNIRHVFASNGNVLDASLVNFLSQAENTETLASQAIASNEQFAQLISDIMHSRAISEGAVQQLLLAFPAIYIAQLNPERTSAARLETICQHPNCRFSFESLDWLARNEKSFHSATTYQYLLRHWDEYTSQAESTTHLTVNTVMQLLQNPAVDIEQKLWLCDILNNENENDEEILKAMLAPITCVLPDDFQLQIRFGRLETLINAARLKSDKVRLVAQQAKYLSWPETLTLMMRLELKGKQKLYKKSRQFTLPNSEDNFELMSALHSAGHITLSMDDNRKRLKAVVKAVTGRARTSASAGRTAQ